MTEAEKIWQDRLTAAATRLDQNRPAYPGTNLMRSYEREAACRLIEEFEAFKQEVSDAVEANVQNYDGLAFPRLSRFIIAKPKPDPLIEAVKEAMATNIDMGAQEYTDVLRQTLAKYKLKIVEVDDD